MDCVKREHLFCKILDNGIDGKVEEKVRVEISNFIFSVLLKALRKVSSVYKLNERSCLYIYKWNVYFKSESLNFRHNRQKRCEVKFQVGSSY